MTARGLAPLSRALRRLVGSAGLERAWQLGPIFSSWPGIVGERLAAVTSPQSVTGRTLQIATRNSAWSHQLTMLKPQLLQRINAALPDMRITDIRFSVTPFESPPRTGATDRGQPVPPFLRHTPDTNRVTLAEAFTRLTKTYEHTVLADRTRTHRCTCGAHTSSVGECPPCRLSQRRAVLATAEALIRAHPEVVRDPAALDHNIPPDILFEAWANIEVRLLTGARVAQTIVARGQEIPPHLRETIETLIIARTGKRSSEATQYELISVIGERLAADLTKR